MTDSQSGRPGFPVVARHVDTGVLIGAVRVGRGLTRQALAERAHVSYARLTKVEAGVEPAAPELIVACAIALGIDSNFLVGPFRPEVHGSLLAAMVARASAAQDVLDLPAGEAVQPRPLPDLAADVRRVSQSTQAAGSESVAAELPRLLAELRIAARTLSGPDQETALRLLKETEHSTALIVAGRTQPAPIPAQSRYRAPAKPAPSAFIVQYGPPAAYLVASIVGLELAKLYYTGNPILRIIAGWLALTMVWLLFWVMKSLGQDEARGRMAKFAYVGVQTWILAYVLTRLHTSWWVLVLCWASSMGVIYARLRQRTRPTDFIGSQMVIVAYVVVSALETGWWVPLVCSAVAIGVTFARLNQPGPPDSFNEVFPV